MTFSNVGPDLKRARDRLCHRHYSGGAWALLFLFLLLVPAKAMSQADPSFGEQVEARVFALVNAFRAEQGLQPIEREARLDDTARYFAGYMAASGRLDHQADGTTPANRVKQRGYDYCVVAENIALEFSSRGFAAERLARNFVEGWQQSPTHRDNMLDSNVTQTGLAIARSARSGEYYAAQVFARPRSQMVKFRVTNRSGATIRYEFRNRTVALAPKQTRTHETCTAADIRIDWPGAQPGPTVRPANGGQYTIVDSGQRVFRLIEE